MAGIRQDKMHPLSRYGWSGLAFDLAGYIILLSKYILLYVVSVDQREGTGEHHRHLGSLGIQAKPKTVKGGLAWLWLKPWLGTRNTYSPLSVHRVCCRRRNSSLDFGLHLSGSLLPSIPMVICAFPDSLMI